MVGQHGRVLRIVGDVMPFVRIALVIVQFLYSWITGSPNEKLLSFSASLSEYVRQLIVYISFNSDTKPWPMGEWPTEVK